MKFNHTFSRIKCRLAFLLFTGLLSQSAFAQILVSPANGGNFNRDNSTFAGNNWTAVQAGQTNRWVVGLASATTLGAPADTNAAFISNTATAPFANVYNADATSISHLYRDIPIPAGSQAIQIQFRYRVNGEGNPANPNQNWDNLKVWAGQPASLNPVAGTEITAATGILMGTFGLMSAANSATEANLFLSGVAGISNIRLVFSWKNDGDGGAQPPASIDNVVVSVRNPTTIISANLNGLNLWTTPASWIGGVVPSVVDSVLISNGDSVSINATVNVQMLSIGTTTGDTATLRFNNVTTNVIQTTNFLISTRGRLHTTVGNVDSRNIFLLGNFINNGVANLSRSSLITALNPTTISGTGTFLGGRIATLETQTSLSINRPIVVSDVLRLVNGVVTTNGNLTLNSLLTAPNDTIILIPRGSGSLSGVVNWIADTRPSINYMNFTGQINSAWSEGPEMPPNRQVHLVSASSSSSTVSFTSGFRIRGPFAAANLIGRFLFPSTNDTLFLSNSAQGDIGSTSSPRHIVNATIRSFVGPVGTALLNLNFAFGRVDATGHRQIRLQNVPRLAGNPYSVNVSPTGRASGNLLAPATILFRPHTHKIHTTTAVTGLAVRIFWTTADSLAGSVSNIVVLQAPTISGPWTPRGGTTTGTLFSGDVVSSVISLSDGEFFALGTTAPLVGNIGAVALVSPNPNTPVSGCFTSDQIRVNVVNAGLGVANFVNDSLLVGVRITAPNGIRQTVSRKVAVGSLAPLAQAEYSLGAGLNFELRGRYTIRPFARLLTNDASAANDSASTFVRRVVASHTFDTPYSQSFDTTNAPADTLLPKGWHSDSTSFDDDFTIKRGFGKSSVKALRAEIWNSNKTSSVVMPILNNTTNNSVLSFYYRIVKEMNYNLGAVGHKLTINDTLYVQSANSTCGNFSNLMAIHRGNHDSTVNWRRLNISVANASQIRFSVVSKESQIFGYLVVIDSVVVNAPVLSTDSTTLGYSAAGGNKSVRVSASFAWTSTNGGAAWLTLPSTGTGNATITVTAAANLLTTPRTATIALTSGSLVRNIVATQAGADTSVMASVDSLIFAGPGQTLPFSISTQANVVWSATSLNTWLTLIPASGTGTGSVAITANPNATPTRRFGKIAVRSGSKTDTVYVRQNGVTSAQKPLATQVSVWPNPAKSVLQIDVQTGHKLEYNLVSMIGQTVAKGSIAAGQAQIGVGHLPAGLYMLHLQDKQGTNVRLIEIVK